MKHFVKFTSIIVLLLLASPVIFLKGCGNAINGDSSGLCPDSVAPEGSTIAAPTIAAAPAVSGGSCYPALTFTVRDSNGPMNGICVVVTTNAAVALTTTSDLTCSNVISAPKTQLVTRTDSSGNVVLDMLTPATTAGTTFSVWAASGALSAVATTPGAQ